LKRPSAPDVPGAAGPSSGRTLIGRSPRPGRPPASRSGRAAPASCRAWPASASGWCRCRSGPGGCRRNRRPCWPRWAD
jgi:hypothetical protein